MYEQANDTRTYKMMLLHCIINDKVIELQAFLSLLERENSLNLICTKYGEPEIFETLADQTPLHSALVRANAEIIECILESAKKNRIDLDANEIFNVPGVGSVTYLQYFISIDIPSDKKNKLVKMMLEVGADPTFSGIATINGHTPLLTAVSKGEIEIVKTILMHAKKINLELNLDQMIADPSDPEGFITLLGMATHKRNIEMVKLLLKAGAEPFGLDPKCVSPLEIAYKNGDRDISDAMMTMSMRNKRRFNSFFPNFSSDAIAMDDTPSNSPSTSF